MTEKPTPPVAPKISHVTSWHGIERDDPYDWMRADNWQAVMRDPSELPDTIREHLEAENAYFEAAFNSRTKELQEQIYAEIRGRMKEDDSSVPSPDGPFAYFSRMETGKQYPLIMRSDRDGGHSSVLLDCNVEAGDSYFGFAGASHSPDHSRLLWAADRNGSEHYTIRVRDLTTGTDMEDVIEGTAGGTVWANDSRTFFYTMLDENHRPYQVWRHEIGTPNEQDALVYEERDPGFFIGIGRTLSRRFIEINASTHETSEVHLVDADNPLSTPVCVSPRRDQREYEIDEGNGTLFIKTNADGAEDYKIVRAPVDSPGAENWVDLIPHRPGNLIVAYFVLRNHLVRLERENGLPRIVIRDLTTGEEHQVSFDEEAYSLGAAPGYEFHTDMFRFTYSSPTTPAQTYDYAIGTGERALRKEQEVPTGHDPSDYVTERLFAVAPDGEEVPVTLLRRADVTPDADTPVFLYGYGSYGHALPAAFSISVLSLVDRGFVYAIAHVRGGMEKGYRWYTSGKREKKPNSFTDFIAAAEHLIERGMTRPGRIVAEGGSAGGMLMGAIANLRPDLFGGIVAIVPFVDVLNTMLDDTLPLTPPEWPEWGNPIASPEHYRLIESYSPYDQVSDQTYPPILAMAGLTDPRVTYWEPAKWVARLRERKSGDNPVYLRTNMGAGHGGASGRFERIKETAIAYAFAVDIAGL